MRKLVVRRVWIDQNHCFWTTLCGAEAPGLIVNVNEGDQSNHAAQIHEGRLSRTKDDLKLLLEASRVCPTNAFSLETDRGEVLDIRATDWVRDAIKSGNYEWEAT